MSHSITFNKNNISFIAHQIYNFITQPSFVIYVVAVVSVSIQLLIFEDWIYKSNPWLNVPILQVIADVMVIMIPLLWLKGRWRMLVWIPIIGMTIFCYVNLWYCRAFYDLMPLESVGMGGNMQDRVIDAFWVHVLRDDWMMLLPVVFFGIVILLYRKHWLKAPALPLSCRIMITTMTLLVYVLAYVDRAAHFLNQYQVKRPLYETVMNLMDITEGKCYKLTQHLSRMGYVQYMSWQIESTFFPKSLSADDRADIDAFWAQKRAKSTSFNQAYIPNRQRNLILIIVESLSADAVGYNINGVAVTPNIDRLIAKDSTAVIMRHVVAQTKHGRSSDGQFIYNTGLLPLLNSVVAKRYASASYPSLAKALKYPLNFEVIGEQPTFYNHSTTNISYGYNHLYAPDSNNWLDDKEILNKAAKIISNTRTQFFCEITTLTMHDPYNHTIDKPSAISSTANQDPRDLNYLEQVRIFDERFGQFIDALKASGKFDNSVIMIASDHEPRQTCLSDKIISSDIFFMALNTGVPGQEINRVVGQIDIFPTVLEIMGVNNYPYPGIGNSVLSNPDHQGVVDAYGTASGNPSPATLNDLKQAWKLSELMVERGYFR